MNKYAVGLGGPKVCFLITLGPSGAQWVGLSASPGPFSPGSFPDSHSSQEKTPSFHLYTPSPTSATGPADESPFCLHLPLSWVAKLQEGVSFGFPGFGSLSEAPQHSNSELDLWKQLDLV